MPFSLFMVKGLASGAVRMSVTSFQTRKVIPRGIRSRENSRVESMSFESHFSSSLPADQKQGVTVRKGHQHFAASLNLQTVLGREVLNGR